MTHPTAARPPLSPAAVKLLADSRRAKHAASKASAETARMPGAPTVTALRGEVQFVVQPESLADWNRWLHNLGAAGVRGESTGGSMVVRCSYSGVRARLIGVGVPALYGDMPTHSGRRTAVRP